jgi:superoxide dismutase, Cu-Zn family
MIGPAGAAATPARARGEQRVRRSAVGSVVTDRFRLADLFDADGSAIIIHVGADNLANIPARYVQAATGTPGPDAATLATGDAGGRFACGVVTR